MEKLPEEIEKILNDTQNAIYSEDLFSIEHNFERIKVIITNLWKNVE